MAAAEPQQPGVPGGTEGINAVAFGQRIAAGAGRKRRPGIEQGFQADIGRQLSNRIDAGAIDSQQAQQVAQQRELLERAFGPDWRIKVFGQGGARGIGGAFAQPEIAAKRTQGLARARAKLG